MQYQPQYQQEYAPQAAQQHFEALPAGYGAPATNGYQQAAQYGGAPMQQGYAPEQQMPYDPQMQYVQQAQYADPGQFQQQAFAGGQPMMQPMHMAQPPMQHTQYVAAPQPAFQQPLGNGGKGKLVKAGRYVPFCLLLAPEVCAHWFRRRYLTSDEEQTTQGSWSMSLHLMRCACYGRVQVLAWEVVQAVRARKTHI
jgi:hypothetical protein